MPDKAVTGRLCFAGYYDKGKRPAEFSAEKGSERRIYVLKREK